MDHNYIPFNKYVAKISCQVLYIKAVGAGHSVLLNEAKRLALLCQDQVTVTNYNTALRESWARGLVTTEQTIIFNDLVYTFEDKDLYK
jgi:hypothetical protein